MQNWKLLKCFCLTLLSFAWSNVELSRFGSSLCYIFYHSFCNVCSNNHSVAPNIIYVLFYYSYMHRFQIFLLFIQVKWVAVFKHTALTIRMLLDRATNDPPSGRWFDKKLSIWIKYREVSTLTSVHYDDTGSW